MELIEWNACDVWGTASFGLAKKFIFVKEKLKVWNRKVFEMLRQEKMGFVEGPKIG